MKKMGTVAIAVLLLIATTFAQTKDVPVFVSGTEGYKSFRIPAVIAIPNGDILAFCEGRVYGAGDFGDIDIVVKRSKDKGKTWGALQIAVDTDSLQAAIPPRWLTSPTLLIRREEYFCFIIRATIMKAR